MSLVVRQSLASMLQLIPGKTDSNIVGFRSKSLAVFWKMKRQVTASDITHKYAPNSSAGHS